MIIVREMHYINLVPKMGQIIKVQRPVSSAPINGLYHRRPVCDIRGRIYISFAGGIIVQNVYIHCLFNVSLYLYTCTCTCIAIPKKVL